jgi:hypothetical protein
MNKVENPLQAVLNQIKSAKEELDGYAPSGYGWFSRSNETANLLVPWLHQSAPSLKNYIQEIMNSRLNVRAIWADIVKKHGSSLPKGLVGNLTAELRWESILLSYVGGDLISKVIEKFLIEKFNLGKLESNGKSDYPDLFLRSKDYLNLPKFERKDVKEYGAALKGDNRPVRVPDGLEVKTCRDRFSVDCHYAHMGLHLVILLHEAEGLTLVDDILVAFLQKSDYRITIPKTGTTTLKASFGGKNFVSLLL